MHVLLIVYTLPTRYNKTKGIFFVQQAQALKSKGIKIGLIGMDGHRLKNLTNPIQAITRFKSIKYFTEEIPTYLTSYVSLFPFSHHFLKWRYKVGIKRMYKQYISEYGKPDIIHAHVGLWSGFYAQKLAHKHAIPLILTEHSTDLINEKGLQQYTKKALNQVYKNSKKIITVSSSLQSAIIKQFNINPIHLKVIPNLIDTKKNFFKDKAIQKKNMICSVGNLVPRKRFDMVIKAFNQCLKNIPELELHIAGEGPEKHNLKALAKELGIEKKVFFLGFKTPKELNNLYNRSKLFVLASEIETFGIVLIEALATGTPVVSTDSGGVRDIILNEKNGYLIPQNNLSELTSKMLTILKEEVTFDPDKLSQYIYDHFSAEVITKKIIDVYTTVLDE